jgi:phage/plasmid primase-like uncharacterized protein
MDLSSKAQGQWAHIHPSLGIPREVMTDRGKPCPMCHGTDRFSYDDKDGRGTYICRKCGAGDGFTLLMKYRGWDFKQCADEVRNVLGITPSSESSASPKRTTQDLALKLWADATDNDTKVSIHQYARRKGFKGACGARRGLVTGKLVGLGADCLIVPSRSPNGDVIGIQCINTDGVKQSYGKIGELVLGDDLSPSLPCAVFEGFASAVAWLNSRDWNAMAVVSFGKGRQMKVAEDIERRYPKHQVLLMEEVD